MLFFSSLKMRGFFVAIFAVAFCAAFPAGFSAQSFQSPEPTAGAIDPLLLDIQAGRNKNIASDRTNFEVSSGKTENTTPSAGEVDSSFSSNIYSFPGNIRSTALQADGKVVVGGFFKNLNNSGYNSIARLNTDNSIDPTFNPRINGSVLAVAVQPDGKILIGGSFAAVNGISRSRVARLNADGSVDTSFNPAVDGVVYDLLIQPDGKILLSGTFYGVNGVLNYGVARLNADGAVDLTFTSPVEVPLPPSTAPASIVYSMALQTDGKVLLAGLIVLGNSFPQTIIKSLIRVNANGSLDSTFETGTINSNAQKVVIQPDGKILLAGFFSNVGGVSRNRIARFNPNGSLDASFDPGTGANSSIYTISLRPNGSILIGGAFTLFNGVMRSGIAQLNPNGSLDTSFTSANVTIGGIYAITQAGSGKLIIGGTFTRIDNENRDSLAVLNANGSLDASTNFTTTAIGSVRATAIQPDGKIIIGGSFNRVNGVARNRLARLNADGSLDTTFANALAATQVTALHIQPDGKILVGGTSLVNSSIGGAVRSVVRLNADGTFDASFEQGEITGISRANAFAVQSDGKILVAYFANVLGGNGNDGGIVRLNPNGSLDTSFTFGIPAQVESVVIQPDGKILVGGAFGFGYVNSGNPNENVFYYGIIRLNADGVHDRSFRSNLDSNGAGFTSVNKIILLPDGKVLIGGSLYFAGQTMPFAVARLNSTGTLDGAFSLNSISSSFDFPRVEDMVLLPSGKVVIGGFFSSLGNGVRNNVARLNANGFLDETFVATADYTVYAVNFQSDGKVVIGGDFETVNGVSRTSIARLLSEPVVSRRSAFDFDGDGKSDISVFRPNDGAWYLNRSSAGFAAVQFGIANDKIAPADYDGDGKTDIAVFREGNWYLQRSSAGFAAIQFGAAGDVPQPADFDGDGKAELALFRPADGTWYVLNLVSNQFNAVQFGISTDKPVVGDYDGDAKSDYAVFRNGVWYLLMSQEGFTAVQFGQSGDKAVAGDYDGDGKTDLAVYRAGVWYVLRSQQGFAAVQFGNASDAPTPADYDGDGKTDYAVYRDNTWYLQQSAQGFNAIQFGANGDRPVPNAFVQ